ncbi:cell wall biosynthesis glycosyltransferase [Streptomyces viridochromogenes]|uniref:Cell wall biosynthesis glycosyltransferase n=1 Tax=Streptomyces viridochromogenes TaxID=1938 RepID=A0A0J7ZP42_STRVR|nr:glycosyltransferase family 2 protein [Streptomyces viridochromogenes]KMS77172.1 cell wall biosynthesis glycosyltransferase [Streptomyces viridochromogenes]KOG09416.1 cell wall biosynthesis glycosyltransferase [Streptomyces viridochromogenes]KOG27322.1 cell wall biosynthesis glycosyltransferase [Streptomyces viridochromogenes]
MPVKVSVVVPVYNPGAYVEDCIASLLRQSLPPDEYEVIFVDDGSTDGTPARLDALAAAEPRVTVIHQENSGWSGKPRNVGIAAARGEYVMFVDNDDHLGDEALQRMYDYGVANGADVVVGKMAGKGRGVPVELFRRNHPRATVADTPLIDSLTPHKMFRRAFLDDIGLRFPEGRRRLEDHVFVTEAYLRASNVSVLSDYVCYFHVRRDDASNAGFQRFDPGGYFKNLREALDVVERYTEPGALRDRLFRRWLRVEMVERMRGRRLLALPADYRRELFEEIHQVVVERFGPGVAAGLQPTQQVVAALVAADRYDDVVGFAEWEAGIAPTAVPERVVWEDGTLRVGFTAEYSAAGEPMTFAAGTARTPLDGPPEDLAAAVAWVAADTVARFGRATADLLVRERASGASYFQPVEFTREEVPAGDDGRVRLVLRATATVDPAALTRAGLWDAFVRVKLGGWTKECRLGPAPRANRPAPYAAVSGGHVVLPYWTSPQAHLALDVDRATHRVGLGALAPDDITVSGDRLRAPLPLHVPDEGTEGSLRLISSGTTHDVPAALSPHGSGALLEAVLPLGELRGAAWRAALGTPGPRYLALPFTLRAGAGGVRVGRTPRPGALRRLVRGARRRLATALGRTAARLRGRARRG